METKTIEITVKVKVDYQGNNLMPAIEKSFYPHLMMTSCFGELGTYSLQIVSWKHPKTGKNIKVKYH